jgi:hypothetical protein
MVDFSSERYPIPSGGRSRNRTEQILIFGSRPSEQIAKPRYIGAEILKNLGRPLRQKRYLSRKLTNTKSTR